MIVGSLEALQAARACRVVSGSMRGAAFELPVDHPYIADLHRWAGQLDARADRLAPGKTHGRPPKLTQLRVVRS
jgi:hypothetical protein